ncbi:hypothetical protein SCALM49S_09154 [Streptomyces californicus]
MGVSAERVLPGGRALQRPGGSSTAAEERFESGQVVGVEVVHPGGEQLGPDGLAFGARQVSRSPRSGCGALPGGQVATRVRSRSRSARGKGPAPSQSKLWVQLALTSGAKVAGAGVAEVVEAAVVEGKAVLLCLQSEARAARSPRDERR